LLTILSFNSLYVTAVFCTVIDWLRLFTPGQMTARKNLTALHKPRPLTRIDLLFSYFHWLDISENIKPPVISRCLPRQTHKAAGPIGTHTDCKNHQLLKKARIIV